MTTDATNTDTHDVPATVENELQDQEPAASQTGEDALDMASILKAAQTLSSETALPQ